eukprot:m.1214994 g.1214994  ORF g.1214994 m.1214994 type:complete len:1097 (-) comp24607_c0_seq1:4742-8032(-)
MSHQDYDDVLGFDSGRPLKTAWFRKAPAKAGFGSSKQRFMEFYPTEIRYYASEQCGHGVSSKGVISLPDASEVKVAGTRLTFKTNKKREWALTAETEKQAHEWGDLIKKYSAAMVDDAQEVDLLPGHGDWMLKRGKGIGKYTEDKLRYFTVVYVKNLQRLRLNYYTQLAGRARIPMGKRGFVAIDYVSKILRSDKKLQIINPGFTWQLTALQTETAVRWERILTQLVMENREAIENAPDANAPRQLPLLGRATELLYKPSMESTQEEEDDDYEDVAEMHAKQLSLGTSYRQTPTLHEMHRLLLADGYTDNAVLQWKCEWNNSVAVYDFTRTLFSNPTASVPGAWMTRLGLLARRSWYELEGVQIHAYKASTGSSRDDTDSGATSTPSSHDGDENAHAFDVETNTIVLSRESTVDVNLKDCELSIRTAGSAVERLRLESAARAVDWAEAIKRAVQSYGATYDPGARALPAPPPGTAPHVVPPPRRTSGSSNTPPVVKPFHMSVKGLSRGAGDTESGDGAAESGDGLPRRPMPRPRHGSSPRGRPLSLYKVHDESADQAVDVIGRATVLYKYSARGDNEMSLEANEEISLLSADEASPWWEGVTTVGGIMRTGWFPAAYVQYTRRVQARMSLIIPPPLPPKASARRVGASNTKAGADSGTPDTLGSEAENADTVYCDTDDELDTAAADVPDAGDTGTISAEDKRRGKQRKIIEEIVKTETDYMEKLHTITKGYITPMRPLVGQLFDESTIGMLFSNVEQLVQSQRTFVADLERAGERYDAALVAEAFLKHNSSFKLYSLYCNNHPRAVDALETMVSNDDRIWSFFEGCRMIVDGALSVAALMIKPVQRICQYPMLLDELRGRCLPDTDEHLMCSKAMEQMREIALTINEEKRLQEEVRALEDKFDGWKGPPLTVYSSKLYFKGYLRKISGNVAHDRYCFLLDNLLVMTRRLLTNDRFRVTGTMFTQGCTLDPIPDGEYTHNKVPVTNAFRVFNIEKQKWYVMVAHSPEDKAEWLTAFAEETKKTAENVENGMNLVEMASTEIGAMHGMKGKRGRKHGLTVLSRKVAMQGSAVEGTHKGTRGQRVSRTPVLVVLPGKRS